MYLIFVDECGYNPDWSSDNAIKEQPFHVISAVALPSHALLNIYTNIRSRIAQLNLPETQADALGRGQEIKANSIDRGEGFWGENQSLRDAVREIYLGLIGVTYFLVCVDKRARRKQYSQPKGPAIHSLQLLFERLQGFCEKSDQAGYVLIDLSKRQQAEQRDFLSGILREGSRGTGVSKFYGYMYEWKLEISNIVEVHWGDSKYSLGLQVADCVARHAYSWRKNNRDPNYPGWRYIEPRLYKYPEHQGWGYKEVPWESAMSEGS